MAELEGANRALDFELDSATETSAPDHACFSLASINGLAIQLRPTAPNANAATCAPFFSGHNGTTDRLERAGRIRVLDFLVESGLPEGDHAVVLEAANQDPIATHSNLLLAASVVPTARFPVRRPTDRALVCQPADR